MHKGHNFELYVAVDKWANADGVPHRVISPINNNLLASVNRPKRTEANNPQDDQLARGSTNNHKTQPNLFIWNQHGNVEASLSSPAVINCVTTWNNRIICGRDDGIIEVRSTTHPYDSVSVPLRQSSSVTALYASESFFISAAANGSLFYWTTSSFHYGTYKGFVTLASPQNIQCIASFNDMQVIGTRENIAVWNSGFNFGSYPDQHLKKHINQVSALCVWRDLLVSASWDHTIALWDKYCNFVSLLEGHTDLVLCLCVWQDRLFSGSTDTTIRTWSWNPNLKKVVCVAVLKGYSSAVTSLCVWNDKLWCCCWNGNIMSWKKMSWEIVRLIFIGWKKGSPEECLWAKLPKDIIREIILLL